MTVAGCDEFRELAPDLALGLLSGDERGDAINHLATCARCQSHLEALMRVADDLLLLAPPVEPEIGFESRVMARLAAGGAFRTAADMALGAAAVPSPGPVPPSANPRPPGPVLQGPLRTRHRWARPVIVAAAASLILVAGMTGVMAGQSRGRDAGRASALREQAKGANQLAARTVVIRTDGGRSTCQLVAFPGTATQPARLVIHLDQPEEPAGSYDVLAEPASGGPAVAIGKIVLVDGRGWLMASIPEGTGPVDEVRILEASQTVRYRATFEPV
jgi:anti-sigma factor RsiW